MSKRIRESAPTGQTQEASRTPAYRRLPWLAIAISIAVVLSAAVAVSPIWDAATRTELSEAMLTLPSLYVALAPLSDTLDLLTLLSARQHIALVAGVLVIFVLWRAIAVVRGERSWRAHAMSAAVLLVSLLLVYAAAAFLPRPMAALITDSANVVRADFHFHTDASHDGHASVERQRGWHRDGGYDVAYVTDHYSVSAAEQGIARNPTPAADGVTLLQGIEVNWKGEHVDVLSAQRTYKGILTDDLHDIDEQGLRLASLIPSREPMVIWNHPRSLDRLPPATQPGMPGVRAIEIANGSPSDMDNVRLKHAQIMTFAEKNNLALVTGTDNHGFGRTAPNWTLVPIVGWRAMTTDPLATRIENVLRAGGFGVTKVVERRVVQPTLLPLTLVTAPWRMLTTLSNEERVSWLVWTWLLTIVAWLRRRSKTAVA